MKASIEEQSVQNDGPVRLEAEDWSYHAEGNQHLILKYIGNSPCFIASVLRVRKTLDPLPPQTNKSENFMEECLQEELLKEMVIKHLYYPDPMVSEMTKSKHLNVENKEEFVQKIGQKIEKDRPEFRRHKSINPKTFFELIFDYTLSLKRYKTCELKYKSITFEIRPKSALFDAVSLEELKKIAEDFLPQEHSLDLEKLYHEHFSKERYDELNALGEKERVKFTRYYKMQIKKQKDHKVQGFTHFDPHDFFKNEVGSIRRALEELIETPQNNLKVFLAGKEIEIQKKRDKLQRFLQVVFPTENLNGNAQKAASDKMNDLLARVLQESKMIEVVQGYQNLYTGSNLHLISVLGRLEELLGKETVKPSEEVLKSIIERIARREPCLVEEQETVEGLIEIVLRFLVSLAFRDCSIIVSLHFLPHKEENSDVRIAEILEEKGFSVLEDSHKMKFKMMYRVGLIDFHLKGIRHAYTHPQSTKELFGLLLKRILHTQKAN